MSQGPVRTPTDLERSRPPFRHATRDELNHETDARFWLAQHYKIKQKLDPERNPTDRAQVKVWLHTFAQVKHEDEIGTLRLTFDTPAVLKALDDAAVAQTVAAAHGDAAKTAPDPGTRDQHEQAVAVADAVVTKTASEAATDAGHPPPSPIVQAAAAEEAKQSPPPPEAPAADQQAHQKTVDPPAPAAPSPETSTPPTLEVTMPGGQAAEPGTPAKRTPDAPAENSGWKVMVGVGIGVAILLGVGVLLQSSSKKPRSKALRKPKFGAGYEGYAFGPVAGSPADRAMRTR